MLTGETSIRSKTCPSVTGVSQITYRLCLGMNQVFRYKRKTINHLTQGKVSFLFKFPSEHQLSSLKFLWLSSPGLGIG